MVNKNSVGVIVARFQSPFVHPGHVALLNYVAQRHDNILLVLGGAQTRGTKRDPLDFMTRRAMLEKFVLLNLLNPRKILIDMIMDRESDHGWSVALDNTIRTRFPGLPAVLYGGRDSFLPRYHGKFKTNVFKSVLPVSSTELRKEVGKRHPVARWTMDQLEYFQRGVIYAAETAFPRVFQTVDMAITRDNGGPAKVLLGWKAKGDKIRFPGGFVDPTDSSLEMAAKRELSEEAPGISVEGDLTYIGSSLIDDWRYKDKDRIMTAFFHGEYTFGHTQAGDDLAGLDWFPVTPATRKAMREYHQPLFDKLTKFLKGKPKRRYVIKEGKGVYQSDTEINLIGGPR